MTRRRALACLASLAALGAARPGRALSGFRLGVLPTNQMAVVARLYTPLAEYMGEAEGRPGLVESGASFAAFHRSVVSGGFDLALTGPHLARLAEVESRFEPLAVLTPRAVTLIVSRRDAEVDEAADLAGRTIAAHDALSIAVILAEAWLASRGLAAPRDFRWLSVPNQSSSLQAVANGLADAAVTTSVGLRAAPPAVRELVRTVAEVGSFPGLVFVAGPGAPGSPRMRDRLVGFVRDPRWSTFSQGSGYEGIQAARRGSLVEMDAHLDEVRRRLATG